MSGSSIRFKRGNKADLPQSASSGTPLWCEDTQELYVGTDNGVSKVGVISQETDTSSTLSPVGISSDDTAALKRNTSVSMKGGTITAQTFIGDFSGNATSATKATNDSNGNNISSTYLPKSGGTVTGTLDLTKTTDLSGTANNSPALRVGAVSGEHLEFDGNEIHAKATATTVGTLNLNVDGGDITFNNNTNAVKISSGKLTTPTLQSGASTFTGAISLANNTLNAIGDDCSFGDQNIGGQFAIKGKNGNTGITFLPYSGSTSQSLVTDGAGNLTISGTTKGTFSGNLTGNVTGNCSGSSSSCTGNSATATKATQDGNGNIIVNTYQPKTTAVTHTASTAAGSATKPVYVNASGVATPITSYEGNSATATKATQDSSGNQINVSYMPIKFSKYAINTYASTNPYIKLASVTFSNVSNYDISNLFWVEAHSAGTVKNYALIRLSVRWSGTAYGGTKFEILEKYGDSTSCFDSLTWVYNFTTASSKATITGEIWMKTTANNWWTYYLRPTQCNEYGDYSQTTVKMNSNPWTYYDKTGNSTAVASASMTSGYTQYKVVDKTFRYHEPLLTPKWFDHKVNDESWLNADSFTWYSGTTYTQIYNELLTEYNAAKTTYYCYQESTNSTVVYLTTTSPAVGDIVYNTPGNKYATVSALDGSTFTISGDDITITGPFARYSSGDKTVQNTETENSITFVRTNKGYKIVDSTKEADLQTAYETYGIAWYYILDTTNKRFKLPRTKWGFKGIRDNAGSYITESLPNITGSWAYMLESNEYWVEPTGAVYRTDQQGNGASGENGHFGIYHIDASRSSSAYKNGAAVQERGTQMYLYFYCGECSKSATEQTAGLNSELLSQKVDVSSLTTIVPIIKTYVNGTSGYRIWSDGYCEQWGYSSNVGQGNAYIKTVTLLKEMANTNYEIMRTVDKNSIQNDPGSRWISGANSGSRTTTTFTMFTDQVGYVYGDWWKVCGYLAEGTY